MSRPSIYRRRTPCLSIQAAVKNPNPVILMQVPITSVPTSIPCASLTTTTTFAEDGRIRAKGQVASCESIVPSYIILRTRGQSMRPDCRRLVCPTRSYHNVLQGIRGWVVLERDRSAKWSSPERAGRCHWAVPRQPGTRGPGSEPGYEYSRGGGAAQMSSSDRGSSEMINFLSPLNIRTRSFWRLP